MMWLDLRHHRYLNYPARGVIVPFCALQLWGKSFSKRIFLCFPAEKCRYVYVLNSSCANTKPRLDIMQEYTLLRQSMRAPLAPHYMRGAARNINFDGRAGKEKKKLLGRMSWRSACLG